MRAVGALGSTMKVRGLVVSLALLGVARSTAAQREPASVAQMPPDTAALGPLLARIRATNPDLIARRRALDAAAARLRAAGFSPASVLTAEVEEVPGGIDVTRAGSIRLFLEHEFLGSGRRQAVRSLADVDVAAASAELDAAERRVGVLGTEALARTVDWLVIAGRLADQDSLLASAEASLQTRFAAGQARYVDVLRLRTERLRAESERAAAVTEGRVARQALLALVARPDSTPTDIATLIDSLIQAGVATPAGVRPFPAAAQVESLLIASGAIRLAEAGVAQATAARQLVLANRRARLTAFVGAERFAGEAGRHLLGPVFGGSVSLPFTAHQAGATAVFAAERGLDAATAQRNAILAARRGALLAARERYEAARARLAIYDAALLRGAREERESALASYRSGSLSLLELLDFERALARAEIDRLRSQIDAEAALTELLTGGADPPAGGPPSLSRTGLTSDAP